MSPEPQPLFVTATKPPPAASTSQPTELSPSETPGPTPRGLLSNFTAPLWEWLSLSKKAPSPENDDASQPETTEGDETVEEEVIEEEVIEKEFIEEEVIEEEEVKEEEGKAPNIKRRKR